MAQVKRCSYCGISERNHTPAVAGHAFAEPKTAVLVRRLEEGWHGDARLYKLSGFVTYEAQENDAYVIRHTKHVIVSAVVVEPCKDAETAIFPADPNGHTVGSMIYGLTLYNELDHTAALKRAGFVEVK